MTKPLNQPVFPDHSSSDFIQKLFKVLSDLPQSSNIPADTFNALNSYELGPKNSITTLYLALCHLHILRISAPQPPYTNEQLKSLLEIFTKAIILHKTKPSSHHSILLELILSTKIFLLFIDLDVAATLAFLEDLIDVSLVGTRDGVLSFDDVLFLIEGLLKQKREKHALEALFSLTETVGNIFREGFWKIAETAKEFDVDESFEDEISEHGLQDLRVFTTVLAKVVEFAPQCLAEDTTYLESLLLLPVDEERLRIVQIVSMYLQNKEIAHSKALSLEMALSQRGKDKNPLIRSAVGRHFIISPLTSNNVDTSIDHTKTLIERINDVEPTIRANTIEEITKIYWNSDNEKTTISERMRDRKEIVRKAAQLFVGNYISAYLDDSDNGDKRTVKKLANLFVSTVADVRSMEDKIHVLSLIDRVVLGPVETKPLIGKKLKHFIHARSERYLDFLAMLKPATVTFLFKLGGALYNDRKVIVDLLTKWDKNQNDTNQQAIITAIARSIPFPTVEHSKKYAGQLLEQMTKKVINTCKQQVDPETGFKEYYHNIQKIDSELHPKKKTKLVSFIDIFVDKLTLQPFHKDMLHHILKTKKLAKGFTEYLTSLASSNSHLFCENIDLVIDLLSEDSDIPTLLEVLSKTHEYIPTEQITETLKESLQKDCLLDNPQITKYAMFLLHTLYDDKERGYYDTIFNKATKRLLKGKGSGNEYTIMKLVIKYNSSYSQRKECSDVIKRITTDIIPEMITEKQDEDDVWQLTKFLKVYLMSSGKLFTMSPPKDHIVHFLINFAIHPVEVDNTMFLENEILVRGNFLSLMLYIVEQRVYDSLFTQLDFYALCNQLRAHPSFHNTYLHILHKLLGRLPLRYFIIPSILSIGNKLKQTSKNVLQRAVVLRRSMYKTNVTQMTQEKVFVILPEYSFQHLISYLAHANYISDTDFTTCARLVEFHVNVLIEGYAECIPLLETQLALIKLSNDALSGTTNSSTNNINNKLHTVVILAQMVMDTLTKGKTYAPETSKGGVSKLLFEFREKGATVQSLLPFGFSLPKKVNFLMNVGLEKEKKVDETTSVPMEMDDADHKKSSESVHTPVISEDN
ncbi:hypothetical protein QTN25_000828 [Entamoeba marina]